MIPGSKSATNRALVLAALADGPSTITGGLDARDTRLMREGLRILGVAVDDSGADWLVTPAAAIRAGGTIDVGLAGTVLRFLLPVAALADGTTTFVGDAEMAARPLAPLLDGLTQLGALIDGRQVPLRVTGPLSGGPARIDASGSSQFVSGLLLAAAHYPRGLDLVHDGASVPSRAHIDLTVDMLRERGAQVAQGSSSWRVAPGPLAARDEQVEPDIMNAAVFLAAAALTGGTVTVLGWPHETAQPGAETVPAVLERIGARVDRTSEGLSLTGGPLSGIDVDLHEISELTLVVAVLACFADGPTTIRGVSHIRGHETDRLAAIAAELTALGGRVHETDDGLHIDPAPLHGGSWHCHADHRLAHAGALVGLRTPGVLLDDVAATTKTLPDFAGLWAQLLGGTK